MALGKDQKEFIKAKVGELGSIQAVKKLYFQDCLVDKWANVYASTISENSQKKEE
jgi:hypothetical protein